MNIRQVLNRSIIRTRTGEVFVLEDNYWNRHYRDAYSKEGYVRQRVRTIDIAEAWVGRVDGVDLWENVTLTKAQQKQLAYQKHLEYVTSPQSETYWCS